MGPLPGSEEMRLGALFILQQLTEEMDSCLILQHPQNNYEEAFLRSHAGAGSPKLSHFIPYSSHGSLTIILEGLSRYLTLRMHHFKGLEPRAIVP